MVAQKAVLGSYRVFAWHLHSAQRLIREVSQPPARPPGPRRHTPPGRSRNSRVRLRSAASTNQRVRG